MNTIVDELLEHRIIFKKMEKIDLKLLKSRKKLDCFLAVDLKDFYHIFIIISAKSRFVLKTLDEIEVLYENLKVHTGINIQKKLIKIDSPICSKAKKIMKEKNWKII